MWQDVVTDGKTGKVLFSLMSETNFTVSNDMGASYSSTNGSILYYYTDITVSRSGSDLVWTTKPPRATVEALLNCRGVTWSVTQCGIGVCAGGRREQPEPVPVDPARHLRHTHRTSLLLDT